MNITEHRITQPVDHFNKSDSREFAQKFTNNDIYYKPGGPSFLLIGAEVDNDGDEIASKIWAIMYWAEKHGANLYFLEHRGYGVSLSAGEPIPENLKYITSEQALADIANFMDAINLGYQEKPKWITFGGSYPGSLSAWFRQKYPEYTVGAVASSAPLEPKLNFFEYLQIDEKFVCDFSPKCAENLGLGIADFESKMYSVEGREVLNNLFHTDFQGDHPDIDDLRRSVDQLYSKFYGGAQAGWDLTPQCAIMTNASNSPLENLGSLNKRPREKELAILEDDCKEIEWNGNFSWLWQTCNELDGFRQQTLEETFLEMLSRLIGTSKPALKFSEKTAKQLQTELQKQKRTTVEFQNSMPQILFWLMARMIRGMHWDFTQSSPFGMTLILMMGASHGWDMFGPFEDENPELKAAHQKIGELIETWLQQTQF